MTSALLIIDVQEALCSGKHAVFEADRVIDRINRVARKARAIDAPVIMIQHEADAGPFEHAGPGWALAAGLETADTDRLVRKRTADAFHHTELHSMLQSLQVRSLIVCGMQSDFCVDTTTRRALALGYPVVLVADGHSTVDNAVLGAAQIIAHHAATLCHLSSFGPLVEAVPADQVQPEA